MLSVQRSLSCPLGAVRPESYFRIVEREVLDPAEILRVLRGEVAGCIFRGVLDEAACRRVTRNFWNHPELSRREDEVPAYFLGAYHYQKTLGSYLEASARSKETLHDIFAHGSNVFHDLMGELGSFLAERGVSMRVAEHQGRQACEFVMRSWSGAGFFALEPHDDGAQLLDPRQAGFEIQDLQDGPLIAVNICLENTGGGGQLHYWNVEPSDDARAELGLELTGYPYPHHVLQGIPRLVLPVRRGDIYFFNGKHVHAVQAQDEASGHRTTISYLMGFKDPTTVLYWS
jgi:hypothetical protein